MYAVDEDISEENRKMVFRIKDNLINLIRIDDVGKLSIANDIDYETNKSIEFEIEVVDKNWHTSGDIRWDTALVTIEILDQVNLKYIAPEQTTQFILDIYYFFSNFSNILFNFVE